MTTTIGKNVGENNPMFGKTHSESARRKIAESRRNYTRENHPSWIGGRRINHNGYIEVLNRTHHRSRGNGYVFEHILIAEKKIGREITIAENVHHINGNKQDNRPENLEVLSREDHTRIHQAGKRKGAYKNCLICKTEYYVKQSRAEKSKLCSMKCVGKYNSLKRKGEIK